MKKTVLKIDLVDTPDGELRADITGVELNPREGKALSAAITEIFNNPDVGVEMKSAIMSAALYFISKIIPKEKIIETIYGDDKQRSLSVPIILKSSKIKS